MTFTRLSARKPGLVLVSWVVAVSIVACGGITGRLDRGLEHGQYTETVGRAEAWVDRHDADHARYDAVAVRLEEARLQEALAADDVAAYRKFLTDFPDSDSRDEVRANLARVEFETVARQIDTLDAYSAFLTEFPDGSYADLARTRSARIAWRDVDNVATSEAYEAYAERYAGESESSSAALKLQSLAWQEATAAEVTVESLLAYTQAFPDDPASPAIAAYAESMQWDTARDEDTVESYARFVSLFPDSEHAAEARTLEVTRAWARAERADTEAAYRVFVAGYPSADRAGLAEERASDLAIYHGERSAGELATNVSQIDDRDSELVRLYVDVRDDNGVLVSGLSARDMRVYENGRRAEVVDVIGMERNRPVDIVFVVDVSGSMQDKIDAVRNSAFAFAQTLRNRQRDVRFGLVSFIEDVEVHNRGRLTDEPEEFQEWIADLDIGEGSLENPALALAEAGDMHFRRGVQRVVILMTDEDPNVAYDPDLEGTTASVAAELAADGVSLFLLVPTGDEYLAIQEITRAARYEIGAAAQGAFGPVLLGIADRLSLQYQVMYRSPDPDRQGGRRARVRVFKPTLWLPAGELPGDEVVAFMADPDEGCRVLAVLATAGIYRSSDCARSWERVEAPDLQYRSAVGNYGADHILYLLTDDGELWTLSGLDGAPLQRDIALPDTEHIAWVESRSHEVWTVSDGRLHVSYDNALGFEPFAVLPSRLLVETLAVDPHVAGRLCGLDDRGAFWCVGAGGAWRTLGFVGSGPGGHVSMCGWRSGLYFVVIDGALFRSIDAGGSWARVEPGAGGRAGRVFQGHQGGVPVLCVSSDTGVSCSDDDGLTWSWIATSGASGRAGWVALRASGGLYWVPAAGGAVSRQAEVTTREFLGSALFDVDEAEPYPDALSLVESLGQTLAANPRLSARVDGHTDSDGDADYNLDLSRRRAESIAAILVSAGARPHQVDAHGYGETRPLFPNDSDENKQANRRVEIVVFQEF